jgi:small-conductance mechanosensitive channel
VISTKQKAVLLGVALGIVVAVAMATSRAAGQTAPAASSGKPGGKIPDKVDVKPQAKDDQIELRLAKILQATNWFYDTKVKVDEGVVFLDGRTKNKDQKDWAEALAGKTEDVVAVVNRIQVDRPPIFNLSPAIEQVTELSEKAVRFTPLAVLSVMALVASWFVSSMAARAGRGVLQRRLRSGLLVDVGSRTIAIPVFLCGLYLALQISGLTRIALTVASAAGLAGLVFGVAFQGILENFLSSVLISVNRPFEVGDLIKTDDKIGFVQRVTTRGTVLIGYDGTYIQVPNAAIYKSTIQNFTANPKMRKEFVIAVPQTAPIEAAQRAAADALRAFAAILKDPEPTVLIDDVAGDKVNLRTYFWVDATQYSDLKVRSAAIREVLKALQAAGVLAATTVATPDEERSETRPANRLRDAGPTAAEGDLSSEVHDLHEQAREAPLPSQGENLLTRGDDRSARDGEAK